MIVDTIADIGFIAYDLYEIGTEGATATNVAALGADIVGAVLPGVTGLGAGVRAADAAAKGAGKGIEVVQRAMSRAELKATQETGLLRGGREGDHYVSDAVNSDAKRAQQRLALPVKPEVRVTMKVPKGKFSNPQKVTPKHEMPGGGTERTATGKIPVEIMKIKDIDKCPPMCL